MDLARCLRGLCALDDSPGAYLLGTCGQIADETEQGIALFDEAVETAFGNTQLLQEHGLFIVGKLCDLRLDSRANGNNLCVFGCCVSLEAVVHCVVGRLAARLVLAYVCNVNNRLHGQQVCLGYHSELVRCQLKRSCTLAGFKSRVHALKDLKLGSKGLVALHGFLYSVHSSLEDLHVGEDKLKVDRLKVAHGVDGAVDVNDVVVFKATNHVQYGVNLANVGKELISQTFALGCTLNKTCNINEFDNCGGVLFGVIHFRQNVHSLVGNRNYTDVWLNGAKGVICGFRARVCEGVEKRTFSYVGKSNYT